MLKLSQISKSYRAITAIENVDFDLESGEVHVLLGENGAGKSTLINVIAGMVTPSSGAIFLNGNEFQLDASRARALGISAVFQEFSLVPSLSVLDNLFLGRELVGRWGLDRSRMRIDAKRVMDDLNYQIDLEATVSSLSRAHRQMVEIAKALLFDVRILILDEPTASLTDDEADRLLVVVKKLRGRGVGVIYVSHRMREIDAIADRITVLRSGHTVGTVKKGDCSESELIEMMSGRKIEALFPHIVHLPGKEVLRLDNVSSASGKVFDISLSLRAGEVVGIAGLVGCGKSEVGRTVFGLESFDQGRMHLKDGVATRPTPLTMLRQGVCYFPSDRGSEGLAANLTVERNITMASLDLPRFSWCGLARPAAEIACANDAIERLKIHPPRPGNPVQNLSGGNRQKVMLARGLTRSVDIFIFDEPTVGIDVGAKSEIYKLIADLVSGGAAVLLISSELAEVVRLSNRAYVMREGRIVSQLSGSRLNEQEALNAFFGDERSTAKLTAMETANG
ncbi:hypothetical protein ASD00_32140 [Ensifer sp. Root31]|uniref:sugar ABC transporter ATP-binding protein n=1 Tax=Ensifer sp. Root31 TaxID=1736512 RepID=UPI00070D9313|nr:sugar ABC transporter ATP-binding protein [Ensifer sp. Root31]KQU85643.1 hypothetical protein ASD00_32140 [Ensifer sp. Root31]